MAKLTRRQIATILSIIYLSALTVLAGSATYSTHTYSLPIPNTLSAFTLALPIITGLAIETSTALASSITHSSRLRSTTTSSIPPVLLPSTLTIVALLIYSTVVATLAGEHISPVGGLHCALDERWRSLWQNKEGDRIRRIQDRWQCCGFKSTKDMAFPFPKKGLGADACVATYGYAKACLGEWRGRERVVAGLMLGVAVGTFLWMVVIVATPTVQPSWARETLGRQATDAEGGEGYRRVIEYRYRDNPEPEEVDEEVRHEIEDLNRESQLDSVVEGSRKRPSALLNDDNRWRVSEDTR